MNKLIFTLLIILPSLILAQEKTIQNVANYNVNINMGMSTSIDYSLFFNKNFSLFYQKNKNESNKNETTTKQNFIEEYINSMPPSPERFYYKKSNSNSIYYNDQTLQRTYDIVDHDISYDWKISNETKKVGNFSCIKATTRFRGRDYTAYFTTDIPLPFGPNKWFGLPGLILEIYDNDYLYHAQVATIHLGTINTILNDLHKEVNNKNFITHKTFLKKVCEDKDEFASIMQSRLPKGISNFTAHTPSNPLEIIEIPCN